MIPAWTIPFDRDGDLGRGPIVGDQHEVVVHIAYRRVLVDSHHEVIGHLAAAPARLDDLAREVRVGALDVDDFPIVAARITDGDRLLQGSPWSTEPNSALPGFSTTSPRM